jgi:hypothetical protein
MRERSNARQRREAARALEFMARSPSAKQPRKPVSLEEYESLLRLAGKEERARNRKGRN